MTIAADLVSLHPGTRVELLVLDATAIGGPLSRFHGGVNTIAGNVVWQGHMYSSYPVRSAGWETSGRGPLPRPTVAFGNLLGAFTALCLEFDDLVGAKIVRKVTFAKYLDAVNFAGGVNPQADPLAAFPDDVFFIDRKATETEDFVEFELAATIDLAGLRLPRRQILTTCSWEYRKGDCPYTGPAVAKIDDTPTTVLAEDRCGKRLASCKLRFGSLNTLPFGGFPSVGQYRGDLSL
jgi:lambda family phage minor tail protein L